MFVGGIVVQNGVDQLAGWHFGFDGVEGPDQLLVAIPLHAATDDAALQHVQRREQRGRAVPLVVMRHGAAAPAFQRQAGLRAIECLDLAFLVERQHHGVGGRIEVEPDDVADPDQVRGGPLAANCGSLTA